MKPGGASYALGIDRWTRPRTADSAYVWSVADLGGV